MTEGIIISIEKKFCTVLADKIKYLCKIYIKLRKTIEKISKCSIIYVLVHENFKGKKNSIC